MGVEVGCADGKSTARLERSDFVFAFQISPLKAARPSRSWSFKRGMDHILQGARCKERIGDLMQTTQKVEKGLSALHPVEP